MVSCRIREEIIRLWNLFPHDYNNGKMTCIDHAPSWIIEEGEIRQPMRLRWQRRKMDSVDNLYIWKF